MSKELGITPRGENFAEWYNDLVKRAELAENSPVRGSMVIRPHGYTLWENMQRALDDMFKATGHVNAYFPLLIPMSFFAKEAEHVEGFAKESAIVTHHRLKEGPNGLDVDPEAKLEEPYVIRPSSETIIWHTYKNWIQSYRDLPILINQWANVMRWELRPRLFLRTTEFLWQEGHTAHATYDEAEQEALTILNECYGKFAEEWMAVPVLKGVKSKNETFAGADHTYTIEAMVQDLRAIQAGTSHHLGQNFAKAFDVQFQSKEGQLEYVYATSWGVSTRLIGTVVMAHGDDKGLVLPPKLAPIQVVIIPIGKGDKLADVTKRVDKLAGDLRKEGVRVKVDDSDKSPGWKYNEWELKGACVRIELGPRDLEAGNCVVARRDQEEKHTVPLDSAVAHVVAELPKMQQALYDRALALREANTHRVDTWDDFKAKFEGEGGGGFVIAHWDGTGETEERISAETKATIRVIPLEPLHPDDAKPGNCVLTGKPSKQRVVFAKAY
ncbi:MAG TPA: proline--tRNA ligase [Fimbriimonadaceae bacterium]|nr:proline--tRNA ligase [Fimbriimonadaceae bacterium]